MAQLIGMFKDALLFKKDKTLTVDSWTFALFNRVTTPFLVACSVAVSARQFFGEPVRCDAGKVSGKVLGIAEIDPRDRRLTHGAA